MESGSRKICVLVCLVVLVLAAACGWWRLGVSVDAAESGAVGIFEGTGDVGKVLHKGRVEFDAAKETYAITGSGENMWFSSDEFQFAVEEREGVECHEGGRYRVCGHGKE